VSGEGDNSDEKTEEEIAQAILRTWHRVDTRSDLPYDGVLGALPEWVPEPIQRNFVAVRNRVLDDWKYTPEVALEWIDRFVTIGTDDNQWFYPGAYPSGLEIDPSYFIETFGLLAHLNWASQLDPDDGIYILGGGYARRGYRNTKNLKPRSITTLTVLTRCTYSRLHKLLGEPPSAKEVLNALQQYDSPVAPVIEEIDWEGETIYWTDITGKSQSTGIGQFNNKVSEIKKSHFQGND